MKSTLKALKYAFIQINKPVTWLAVIAYLILFTAPGFIVLGVVSDSKFNVLTFKIPMTCAMNAIFLIIMAVFRLYICSCKYNYSLSFSKKLFTVVPVIFSFVLSIVLCTLFISLAGRGCGRESLSAVFLIGSTAFSLIGIASAFCCARIQDYLISYLITVAFCSFLTDDLIKLITESIPVALAVIISMLVFALSISFTILYLNKTWKNKLRYKNIRNVYSYLFGK